MYPVNHLTSRFCIVLILILPLLLFWRWVFWGEALFWGTTLLQFQPWHELVKTSFLAGAWPLWNPLLGNGAPLLANLQSAVFYAPNLLYLILPVEHGLTLSIVLHLALAGLFMYLYIRYLGLHPFAATCSALTYMFSGYIVGRTQFVVMVNAAAWLPLLLLLSDRLAQRRNPLDIIWLGLALAVQLLAGHAQLWFYSLWLIGSYVIFRGWPRKSQRVSESANQGMMKGKGFGFTVHAAYPLLGLALAVILALLLCTAQLLPTAEFTTQSPRSSGAERTFALTYSFWPWRLLTLLMPNFFGHPAHDTYWGYANFWEDHAYLGILPFLLALVAVWDYGLRQAWGPTPHDEPQARLAWRVVPFFAVLVPISLILALGWNTPFYLAVFEFVPGFGFFQAPARLLIWYTVAMAVLAGIGAQSFSLTRGSRRGWQRLLVAAIGLTLAGVAGNFVLSGRSLTFLTATMMLGLGLVAAIVLLLLRPRPTGSTQARRRLSKEAIWQGAVLALVALDLLGAAWPLIPTLPATIFRQPITSAEFLKMQPAGYRFFVAEDFDYITKFNHYFRFKGFGPAEPAHWQALRETLIPNLGVSTGLASTNNYDPLVVGRWQTLADLLAESDNTQRAKLLALMNVGYFVDDGSHPVGLSLYQGQASTIQSVPEALPRAYFVSRADYAPDEAQAVARLISPDFDYHREVIIMGNEVKAETEAKTGPVEVIEQGPNNLLLKVEAPAPGFVVLTDTFYPGWQATVDGQPAQIRPANVAFRAVAVEAGLHEIAFNYRPRSFTIGLWVSAISLTLTITLIVWLIKRKRLVVAK